VRVGLGLTCWVLCLLVGMTQLELYSNAPGEPAQAPPRWPADTSLELHPDLPTLLLFIHPRCPCSRATLRELARLVANREGRVDAVVCFTVPAGVDEGWAATDLWSSACSIPGVEVRRDPGGAESQRFGASTSGQALLYAPGGGLLFSGGLTAARGHEGDNIGRSSVESLVQGEGAADASPVFGCPLSDDEPDSRPPQRSSCCQEVQHAAR